MNPTYKTSLQSPQAFDESVIFTNLLHDVMLHDKDFSKNTVFFKAILQIKVFLYQVIT